MTPQNEMKMVEAIGGIHATLKGFGKSLENLDHAVMGNGQLGLKTRVDRLEQTLKWAKRVGWAIVLPGLAALGVGLLNLAHSNTETPHEVKPPVLPVPLPGPGGNAGVQPVHVGTDAVVSGPG